MDHELDIRFTKLNGQTYGLETAAELIWYKKLSAERFTEALKAGNYELAEAALPGHDSDGDRGYFKKLGNGDALNGLEIAYKKGLFLYDYHLAKLMDDDFGLTLRTRNWLPRFIHFHQTLSSSLYVVGVGHLIGQQGLLSLLPEVAKGVEISYLGPHGFTPYRSPFNHNNISNTLIERALAVERALGLTASKEIYQETQQSQPCMILLQELAASAQNHNHPIIKQNKVSSSSLIPYQKQ